MLLQDLFIFEGPGRLRDVPVGWERENTTLQEN